MHRSITLWVLSFVLLTTVSAAPFEPGRSIEPRSPENREARALAAPEVGGEPSWVLVRLRQPLDQDWTDGRTFSLATGHPGVDALLTAAGVYRIDPALPVSLRDARDVGALRRLGLDRTYRFHVPPGTDVLELTSELSRLSVVEYAEPDEVSPSGSCVADDVERLMTRTTVAAGASTASAGPLVSPNDPLFPGQPYLSDNLDAINAWEISTGASVLIAVLGSGVDLDHPDLAAKLVPGHDFWNDDDDPEDDNGNGTRRASIAAAETDNMEGIAGACWGCRLMPLKTTDATGASTASSTADAIVWATDHGARVILHCGAGAASLIRDAIAYAYDAGVVVLDNVAENGSTPLDYPARDLETIAVGATNLQDDRIAASSYGPRIDVVAPGENIWGASLDGEYSLSTGPCAATSLVAGLVGLMETVNPALGREEARHLIRSAAEDEVGRPAEDTPGFDIFHGWGRVDMTRSLEGTASSTTLRLEEQDGTRVFFSSPNPLADSYDFVRGDLDSLSETWAGVDVGSVVCLENDSLDPDTSGNPDTDVPAPGQGFFYLGRFNGPPGPGSYGGSSMNRDRKVFPVQPSLAWTTHGAPGALFGIVRDAGDVNGDGYDDVIVGAYEYTNDQLAEGAAFVYLGSPTGLEDTPVWQTEGDQTGSRYGWAVSTAGDVNNDGYDDILVGSEGYDTSLVNAGRVLLYLGSANGPETTPHWILEGDQTGAGLGNRARTAGDVNNDGYDDVLVTAWPYAAGLPGEAWVFHGSKTGLDDTPDWNVTGPQPGGAFGVGGGTAGDVNGDGFDDIVIGEYSHDGPQVNEGRFYVYHGSADGVSTVPARVVESDVTRAYLGYDCSTAGDVNGDGYDDIVVASIWHNESREGAALVYLGSADGVESSPAWTFATDQRYAQMTAVSTAGDVNGDGFDDVIVGSDGFDGERTDEGRAWVFLGSSGGLSTSPAWHDSGGQSGALMAFSAATAGDVNGDGKDDIIVGAIGYDLDAPYFGRAVVYHGPLQPASTTDCP